MVFAAPAKEAAGSPVFLAMFPGVADCLEKSESICEVESCAFSPSSQVIFTFSRSSFSDQKRCAMTATPEGICSMARTPGILRASVASKLTTLPPNTGGRATRAKSIPGSRTSRPNCAVPSTLEGVSKRRTVRSFLSGSGVNHHAFLHAALGSWDAPFLCSGINEHDPRHSAHFAETLPLGGCGAAAASHLNTVQRVVVHGVDGSGFDFDFGPVRFEFFVEEHGQAGVDALAHFGVIGNDGDGVVRRDSNEGVRREDSGACRSARIRVRGQLRDVCSDA